MNFNSPEWKDVCDEIDRRVALLDKQNRALGPEQFTAHLRGQIAALVSFRNWEEASALPDVQETVFR